MPFDIQIRKADKLILARIWGQLDNELFTNYILATEGYAPIPEDYRLLLVFDEETRLELDTSLIRELARRPPVFSAESTRVVVATEDLAFGLSRIYIAESRFSGDLYVIVRTLEAAADVLNIDVNALDSLQWQV